MGVLQGGLGGGEGVGEGEGEGEGKKAKVGPVERLIAKEAKSGCSSLFRPQGKPC